MNGCEVESWDEAFEYGYRIIIRANRLGDNIEEELELGRVVAKALLMGRDPEVIQDLISVGCEDNIRNYIAMNTH